jgi:hypothetical protein
VGLRLERIPEEDQEVDRAVGDHRPDLEVAAQRPGLQQAHRQVKFALEHDTGRPRGDQVVFGEHASVEPGPFDQVLLLVVVGNQADPFAWFEVKSHIQFLPARATAVPRGRTKDAPGLLTRVVAARKGAAAATTPGAAGRRVGLERGAV